jgi:GNAT superfamily N-acetyltransferase
MVHIRPLTAADLPLGLHLSRQAGWNQTEADWRRALALEPDGCFVAELDGTPVGTTTLCLFGPVAWVAMVLVDASWRGRGVGRALLEHALAYLEGRAPSVRLDATPLGEPLYRKLGFAPQFALERWAGEPRPGTARLGVGRVGTEGWQSLLELDAAVTHTERRKFLLRLLLEAPGEVRAFRRGRDPGGWMTARVGYNATQLGPCVADAEAGPPLLADALARHAGRPVYLDVPEGHPAGRIAREAGLTVQRRLLRMVRGWPVVEEVEKLWASSGPEKG